MKTIRETERPRERTRKRGKSRRAKERGRRKEEERFCDILQVEKLRISLRPTGEEFPDLSGDANRIRVVRGGREGTVVDTRAEKCQSDRIRKRGTVVAEHVRGPAYAWRRAYALKVGANAARHGGGSERGLRCARE